MRLWLSGALIAGAAAVVAAPTGARAYEDWDDILEDRREYFEEQRESEREYWEDRREAEREYWDRARDRWDGDDWWDDDRRWRRGYYRPPRPYYDYGYTAPYYGYYRPYHSNFRFGPVYGGWGPSPYGYYNYPGARNYYGPRSDGFRFYLGW